MQFLNLIGILTMMFGFLYRIIPIIGMSKLCKSGDIRAVPYLLYLTTLCSTSFFTVYGMQIKRYAIWSVNGSGVLIYPIYLTVYIYYCKLHSTTKIILISLLFGLTNINFFVCYYYVSQLLNGAIASTLSIVVQSSQIITIVQVIYHKNSIYIDVPLIFSFLLSNSTNVLYGMLLGDFYLWISMFWGCILNLVSISLSFCYEKGDKLNETVNTDENMTDQSYMMDRSRDTIQEDYRDTEDNVNEAYVSEDSIHRRVNTGSIKGLITTLDNDASLTCEKGLLLGNTNGSNNSDKDILNAETQSNSLKNNKRD